MKCPPTWNSNFSKPHRRRKAWSQPLATLTMPLPPPCRHPSVLRCDPNLEIQRNGRDPTTQHGAKGGTPYRGQKSQISACQQNTLFVSEPASTWRVSEHPGSCVWFSSSLAGRSRGGRADSLWPLGQGSVPGQEQAQSPPPAAAVLWGALVRDGAKKRAGDTRGLQIKQWIFT